MTQYTLKPLQYRVSFLVAGLCCGKAAGHIQVGKYPDHSHHLLNQTRRPIPTSLPHQTIPPRFHRQSLTNNRGK